jgi:coenzyme F420 hydrogenase subunit beta
MSFVELQHNIIDKDLCARCGVCIGVCPVNAIGLDEDAYPELIERCTDCGFCTKCCPGGEVDYPVLSKSVFGTSYIPDTLEGHVESRYVCHSLNEEDRNNGASGGMVTALLVYMLEKGKIDGAVVVGMDAEIPYRTKGILATTIDEIRDAAKSKYCITPSMEVFQEIRKRGGRYAVVALPCQIHGLRKMASVDGNLSGKIVCILGLYCHSNMNLNGHLEALEVSRIPLNDVARFEFRGGGWPGGFYVTKKDGSSISLHKINIKNVMTVMFRLYGADRCGVCVDALAEYADLSFGDFWAFDYTADFSDLERCTLISQRTQVGLKILREAEADGAIAMHLLPEERMSKRILAMARGKKSRAFLRLRQRESKGMPKPSYKFEFPVSTMNAKGGEAFLRINSIIRGKRMRKLILSILFSPLGIVLNRINIARKNILLNYHNN